MKVRDVMTADVEVCRPETNLAAVVRTMWDRDCGFVPVVDSAGALRGALTDRDICVATATRRLLPEYMTASQVMTSPVHVCRPGDDVDAALEAMKRHKVRRLPVTNAQGAVEGVISINDIVCATERGAGPDARQVVSTLASICSRRSTAAGVKRS
jgi:CBS domain-containing protein